MRRLDPAMAIKYRRTWGPNPYRSAIPCETGSGRQMQTDFASI